MLDATGEAADSEALEESDAPLPPEAWLKALQALREAGDDDAFRKSLESFRAVYPDYPLPEGWAE